MHKKLEIEYYNYKKKLKKKEDKGIIFNIINRED